ncbi:MAG: hypothetical protein MUF64_09180 [Polyangiaceae bacterium]|nr:hypothetical protein [Polyangiaceae bacterium]
MLLALAGCGGVRDPGAVKDRPLSSLEDDDLRGICAFNTKKSREAIPIEHWDSIRCANLMFLEIKAYNNLMGVHDKRVSREECASRLAACTGAPTYEVWSPERDCERVDTGKERQCQATVAELQACIEERIARTNQITPRLKEPGLCDVGDPFAELNTLAGPACKKFKERCPDSNLVFPGFIRAIK